MSSVLMATGRNIGSTYVLADGKTYAWSMVVPFGEQRFIIKQGRERSAEKACAALLDAAVKLGLREPKVVDTVALDAIIRTRSWTTD